MSVQYYFFDDIKCKTNNNYRFGFICEKPLQKGGQLAPRQADGKFFSYNHFFFNDDIFYACLLIPSFHWALQKSSYNLLSFLIGSIFFNLLTLLGQLLRSCIVLLHIVLTILPIFVTTIFVSSSCFCYSIVLFLKN